MTTEAFVRRTYPVKAGETVLVHAAVGGVGQIMTQWLKAIGAQVIATVGSEEKAAKARALGADHVILYREQGRGRGGAPDHRRPGRAGGL
jgi:NADPH2:quinone reductase